MRIEQHPKFLAQLVRHEGLELTPYRCTEGALTIGYGHNLDANPIPDIHAGTRITKERARRILVEDCRKLADKLDRVFSWWRRLNEPRQAVILNMAFNMGVGTYSAEKHKGTGLSGFPRMLEALREGDYERAADEMLDSKWRRDVKNRACELAAQMQTGEWQEGV